MKARRIGLKQPEDLERLAVRRGLRYYDSYGDSTTDNSIVDAPPSTIGDRSFSNEELSLALLSPAAPSLFSFYSKVFLSCHSCLSWLK